MTATNYKPQSFLKHALLILIFIAVAGGTYLLLSSKQTTSIKSVAKFNLSETSTITATIIISDKSYPIIIKQGLSAFDAIKLLSEKKEISFVSKNYAGIGDFIEEINGFKNDQQNGKYWIYYINGEPAKIGASQYIIKNNDLIKWNYEKSSF